MTLPPRETGRQRFTRRYYKLLHAGRVGWSRNRQVVAHALHVFGILCDFLRLQHDLCAADFTGEVHDSIIRVDMDGRALGDGIGIERSL